MEDAHLRYFDFKRKEQKLRVATGGFVQQGTATRTIRVNMPSGRYDVSHSSTSIIGDAEAFDADDLAASIKTGDRGIQECPERRQLPAHRRVGDREPPAGPVLREGRVRPGERDGGESNGQAKTVSVYAQGNDGGRAAGARWTVMDPTNAAFTPGSPSGANPTINYTVSTSPSGDHVRVTLKFTSTAGVGKDTWTQPIGALYRGKVTGTRGVHGPCDPTRESPTARSSERARRAEHPFPIVDAPIPTTERSTEALPATPRRKAGRTTCRPATATPAAAPSSPARATTASCSSRPTAIRSTWRWTWDQEPLRADHVRRPPGDLPAKHDRGRDDHPRTSRTTMES